MTPDEAKEFICPFLASGTLNQMTGKRQAGGGERCLGDNCMFWVETYDHTGCSITVAALLISQIDWNTSEKR